MRVKRFAQLYREIDQTTRLSEKTAALVRYFEEAPPADAAWALWVLTGRKIAKGFTTRKLAGWALEVTGLPEWMLGECYEAVGDFGEELALLLENAYPHEGDTPAEAGVPGGKHEWPLHVVVEEKIKPLRKMSEVDQRVIVVDVWANFDATERFLYHKLISGEFRIGAAKKLVITAVAQVAGVEPAVMEHRLMGKWEPTAADYLRLMSGEVGEHDPGQPYPFFLAYQLDDPPSTLGEVSDWQIEWKWDGIRAQLIKRNGQVLVWSRGEELITEGFPELKSLGTLLPDGTVLDGEVLAYEFDPGDMPTEVGTPSGKRGRPLPFGDLQKRINRKRVEAMLFQDVPVVFMAYDVLEWDGEGQRAKPQAERRALLETICARGECRDPALVLSEVVTAASWEDVETLANEARERGVEGFMFKRKDAAYGVGRTRGQWWKWKVDPFSVDCVLVYAQRGNGKRASVYSDYTFAVWDRDVNELVPVTKAYSGLTDEEINQVDRWVRRNATDKHGPVRVVKPELVFEIHFEGIRESDRHRSGVALRFPRMHRWRHDKKPEEADTLETLRSLLKQQRQPVTGRR